MKILITGIVFLACTQVHAIGYKVKSAECSVQKNDQLEYEAIPLIRRESGDYSASLPNQVFATLKSMDSGFTVFYHELSVQQGSLKVSSIGETLKTFNPQFPVESTLIRTEGQIAEKQFYCDAEIIPIK